MIGRRPGWRIYRGISLLSLDIEIARALIYGNARSP
jgi:hypothetical protein